MYPHQVDRRRFHGRDHDRTARIVEPLDRHGSEVPARDEGDPYGAADDRWSVPFNHHLKFLRAMMGRAVILRGREKANVIPDIPLLHQRRDELIRRQAAEPPVFGRHDDVEPARGACDLPLGREATQCLARRRLGDPEGRAKLG